MSYYQQGDVLLFKKEKVQGKKLKTNVLWKGQNHHKLKGKFSIYKDGADLYVKSEGCELYHKEHKPIKLEKGNYRLQIVMEYDHFLEESRAAID